jgi:nucleoside-diphosphate-sugar epimerase
LRTILITGANGFIAGLLAARLKSGGCRVVGTVRRTGDVAAFDATYPCVLGEPLRPVFEREHVDAVVHAANYAGANEYRVNVEGTTRWLEEARAHAVPTQVFLSSLSAGSSDASEYGRAKRELEARVLPIGGIAVRLGLVIGAGGLFGRMIDSVRRWPLLPVLDNGAARVHVVGSRFLTTFVDEATDLRHPEWRGRTWHIHQPVSHSLREVLETIRTQLGARCRLVPVPSLPVLCALVAAERIPGLRLPVNSTNIRGLRAARYQSVPSDLERLGGTAESLDTLVAVALGGVVAR